MPEQVFFYGTLRTGFNRTTRAGIDTFLKFAGRASIKGKLFDLGIYPAAVPAADGRVWGEVFEMVDAPKVLAALDVEPAWADSSRRRSIGSRVIAPRNRSAVCTPVRVFQPRSTMAVRSMSGCISIMRRSDARRELRQVTTSSI